MHCVLISIRSDPLVQVQGMEGLGVDDDVLGTVNTAAMVLESQICDGKRDLWCAGSNYHVHSTAESSGQGYGARSSANAGTKIDGWWMKRPWLACREG